MRFNTILVQIVLIYSMESEGKRADFYYKIGLAAKLLGKHKNTVRYWVEKHILAWMQDANGYYYFSKSEVDKIANELPYGTATANKIREILNY